MIDTITPRRSRTALLVPLAVAGLLLSACGSDSSGSGASTDGGSSSMSSGGGTAGAAQIATADGSYGTYLTGSDGRAVYLWEGDTGAASTCSGACASSWPPVLTNGTPTASGGARSADLGTSKRSDGSVQVTYQGHPLYFYAGDSGAGQLTGQGSNGFGAKWWLVSPSGTAISGSSNSPSGPGGMDGSYGGGGGY